MFGIGMPELIIILVIILIIFGAGKLPEIGSGIGKAIRTSRAPPKRRRRKRRRLKKSMTIIKRADRGLNWEAQIRSGNLKGRLRDISTALFIIIMFKGARQEKWRP